MTNFAKKLKQIILRVYFFINRQLGIDPKKLYNTLISLNKFIFDYLKFKKKYNGKIILNPCLQDWFEEAGDVKSEYFIQDLFVAQKIFQNNPIKHVDVGSRIDGFVSNVASFRQIEVYDVRDLKSNIENITFKSADFSKSDFVLNDLADSLSCLHTLEHFGLGRYGDPVSVDAYLIGFHNLVKCLKDDGKFYLSVPIGEERVEFNANRVFDPKVIIDLSIVNNLKLEEFYIINRHALIQKINFFDENEIFKLANERYNLGIFIFKKLHS